MIQNASLDTSFWNIASQAGVVPYLFDYFRVHYCQSMAQEIVTTDPNETPLIYPQAMLFNVLREDGRLHTTEPQEPLVLFGSGEAHAIALAREQGWWLLINDSRPLAYAKALGIPCVSVPDFCVLLFSQGRITESAANGILKRLQATTASSLIAQANMLVERIATLRGETK